MPGAGDLREELRFQKRAEESGDGYGNTDGAWETQFTTRAGITPMRGSETIIAQRLAGVQPVIITIRSCNEAREADHNWRAVDTRSGAIYNLKAGANFDKRGHFIDFMAETGVPT